MDPVVSALKRQLQEWKQSAPRPLEGDPPLVVGVSGGPDSVVLLHALLFGRDGHPLYPRERLIVGHLDHQLRPTAAAEAAFVVQLAAEWRVACQVEQADVQKLAREQALSLEEAARMARYRFLARLGRRQDAAAVVVAHHADDQVETVLMHLLRGSGLTGLRGMLPMAPLLGDPSLWLLRPLLSVTRSEIEAYVEAHHLQPVVDLSNLDTHFFRNQLRHEVLPVLEAVSPGLSERLAQTVALVAADEAFLEQATQQRWQQLLVEQGPDWVRVDKEGWQRLPLALRRRTLRHAVANLHPGSPEVSFRTVEFARQVADEGPVGSQATLPGETVLAVEYATLLFARGSTQPASAFPQLPDQMLLALPLPGRVPLEGGWVLAADLLSNLAFATVAGNQDRWTAYLDAAAVSELFLRGRQPGERLQPLGMEGHTRKVKELMIDAKIPESSRARWPVVVARSQAGSETFPAWIAGLHLDRRVRVTASTTKVIRLRCLEE